MFELTTPAFAKCVLVWFVKKKNYEKLFLFDYHNFVRNKTQTAVRKIIKNPKFEVICLTFRGQEEQLLTIKQLSVNGQLTVCRLSPDSRSTNGELSADKRSTVTRQSIDCRPTDAS